MVVEFDQHFLDDNEKLNKIISSSEIKKTDNIFEIGIGSGILTKEILKQSPNKLISVEKDTRLINYAKEIAKNNNNDNSNFDFVIGDGIEVLREFVLSKKYIPNKIIANIPYSITENLYKNIIDLKIETCVFLQGKKFYDILTNENSYWRSIVGSFYNFELVDVVSGQCFKPKTKVNSVILKLTKKNSKQLTKKMLFTQILFSKRSRGIKNAIIYSIIDYNKKYNSDNLELLSKKNAKQVYDKIINNLELNNSSANLEIEKLILEKRNFENLSSENYKIILNEILKNLNII